MGRNTGRKNRMATIENSMPPIAPAANENQNGSRLMTTNGTSPNTVESTVSMIGTIFRL